LSRRFTELRPPPNPEDLPADLRKQMEEEPSTQMTELEMAALNGELETIPISNSDKVDALIPTTIEESGTQEIIRDKVDVNATLQDKALKAIQQMESDTTAEQVLQLTNFVKQDKFDITFEDGTTRKFYRVGLNEDLTEQIKDIQSELETNLYLEGQNAGTEISKREIHLKKKQLRKLGLNYLKDFTTRKTMTEAEAKKVSPGNLLVSIINACVYRTMHEIVDPKV